MAANALPTQAVALHYDPQDPQGAPFLSAKGRGHLAAKLVDIAKEHNIPIVHNPELVECLTHLQILEAIPESLYEVVAHILLFVYGQELLQRYPTDAAPPQD